jgi:hypothetical protein
MRIAVLSLLILAGLASAQGARAAEQAPPARQGFQMALRTGFAIPMGKVSDGPNADMSNSFGWQVPFLVEIGGKLHPNFFLGGYLGVGFGSVAGDFKRSCDAQGISCGGFDFRLGIEAQYHFSPAAFANPWLGYGIGYEIAAVGGDRNGQSYNSSVSGLEFAHLMGGVDFRFTRVFGVGPFVDFAVGEYGRAHSEIPGGPTFDGDINQTATHEWLTFGARFVFFP